MRLTLYKELLYFVPNILENIFLYLSSIFFFYNNDTHILQTNN